ncbi:MAG TPA: EamA family transporter [Acidimicrobiia bacterium]|nr:EamA family transporter [Acidimicrobiia bacterium]
MAVLLGVVAAAAFGAADFLGGFATKRSKTTSVLVCVQATGLALAVILVLLDDTPLPGARTIGISMGAGAIGMTSLGLFYRALATGRMGVVAPLSAVIAAIVPVTWGLTHGERPSGLALTGVAVAVAAVALVAREPDTAEALTHRATQPVTLALVAGVGFGITVTGFSEVADGSGFWPLIFLRVAGVVSLGGFLLVTRRFAFPREAGAANVIGGGILDLTGNAAILQGFREGLTSVVAPVSALFPAATVILARIVLKERLTRLQLTGVAVALLGLVLIGLG